MPQRAKHPEDKAGHSKRAEAPKPVVIDQEWSTPAPPESIEDVALWDAVWSLGGPAGVYNAVADYGLIERYVSLMERRRDLLEVIDREGWVVTGSQGQDIQHPAARILADAEGKLVPIEDRLGLSPQARHTIQVGHVQAKSAIEKWLED